MENKNEKKITKEDMDILINTISHNFGSRIRRLRREYDLTQKQVAEKLIISESTYAKWEQGRTEPSLLYLLLLTRVFEISLDEMFDFFPVGKKLE